MSSIVMIFHMLVDLLYIMMIPVVYYIEKSKKTVSNDLEGLIPHQEITCQIFTFYFYF